MNKPLKLCWSVVKGLATLFGLLQFNTLPLHANMIQKQRLKNLERFKDNAIDNRKDTHSTLRKTLFVRNTRNLNMFYRNLCFGILLLCLLAHASAVKDTLSTSPKEQKEKSTKLPPCKSCTVLVESFKVGLDKTSRGKHAGGDAAWEEEKLRSYKTSEVRLVEIQEHLCGDVKRGEDQCHSLANDHEHLLEDWFLHKQTEASDLHAWFCIEQLKVCCPEGHYGPECSTCTDCSGNGKCKGEGTRKGNGKCACDAGYAGENCSDCAVNYYVAFRDETKLLCSPCHKACAEGGCSGAGAKACLKCKDGWRQHKDSGCLDINECLEMPRACRKNQFCVNDEGSYTCLECDRSCDGCDGDGPDMCKKCADGYQLKDGKCEAKKLPEIKKTETQNEDSIAEHNSKNSSHEEL